MPFKYRQIGTIVLVIVLSGGAFAYKKIMSLVGQPGAASAAAGTTDDEASDQTSERLNQYIECMNYVTRSARRSRESYLRDVDEKAGPDPKSKSNIYIGNLQQVDDCKKSLAKAKTLKPPMPEFDALAGPYEKALDELAPLVDQAHKYYDNKDFKDDKYAKGIAMHAPLVAAFTKFFDATKALDDKVTKLNDELSASRLVRLAKDPNARLRYLIEKTQADAKTLVDAADIGSLKDLDLAKFNGLLDGYEKTLGELDTYATAHKAEVDKVTMFSRFDDTGKDFLKSAKELMRHKRDNQEFQESSAPQTVDGHPAQVMDRYNTFIQSSNSLYFR